MLFFTDYEQGISKIDELIKEGGYTLRSWGWGDDYSFVVLKNLDEGKKSRLEVYICSTEEIKQALETDLLDGE